MLHNSYLSENVSIELAVLQLLYYFFQVIQPVLVPLCFAIAWIFTISLGWTLLSATRDAVVRAKQMHNIPCTNCQFFTNDYRLKCTIRPSVANTEQATNCSDYSPCKKAFAFTTEDLQY